MENNLFSDWIKDRDHNTYVSRFDNEKSRLNWEEKIDKSNGFSSFLYNFKEDEKSAKLLENTYKVARTRLDSMGLFKYEINLSNDSNFTTGKKSITISTDILDREYLKANEKIDVILGEVVHEAAHCLYTNFNKKIKQDDILKLKGTQQIVFDYIFNIIEDEQIERNIGKNFPGYVNYLAQVKKFLLTKIEDITTTSKKSTLMEILEVFFYMIRYPKKINTDLVIKHEPLIRKLREIFEGKYPSNTIESLQKTIKVFNLLADYIKKKKEEEEKKKEKEKDSENNSDNKSDESDENESDTNKSDKDELDENESGKDESNENESDENKTGENKSDENDSEEKESDKNESGNNGTSKDTSGNNSGKDKNSEIDLDQDYSDEKIESNIDKDEIKKDNAKIDSINALLNSSLDNSNKKRIDETTKISLKKILQIQGEISEGVDKTYFINKMPKGNPTEYKEIKNKYLSIISTVSKKLNFDSYSKGGKLYGLKNGNLDTSKLAEAVQGIQNVYNITKKKKIKKNVIGILIDESGSMLEFISDENKTKAELVKEMAIILNEAISKTKSELFIYGHTADRIDIGLKSQKVRKKISNEYETYITVYKEPNKNFDKNQLTHIDARANNRDGVAIYNTVKRIRNFTQEPLILFVLSDGYPNAYGYSGVEHTRTMVKQVQKLDNTTVIGIGIKANYPMETIYDHYLNYSNLKNFPIELNKLILKLLKNGTKSI